MKKKNLLQDKTGTSMIFAIVLFLVVTVFGMNLLNAVNANVLDTTKEIEKEQALLYITSVYDVVNQMICEGKFSDASGNVPGTAEADFSGKGQTIHVTISFSKRTSSLQADILISYNNQEYKINNYYTKLSDKYKLEKCYGLEGV